MARTDNLSNFLTDVADAIRSKITDQSAISPKDFDTKILNIPGGSTIYEETGVVAMDDSVSERVVYTYSDGMAITLCVDYATLAQTIGLSADKIAQGETILGIEGTYTGNNENSQNNTSGDNDTGLNNGGGLNPAPGPTPAPGPDFEPDPGPGGETGNNNSDPNNDKGADIDIDFGDDETNNS